MLLVSRATGEKSGENKCQKKVRVKKEKKENEKLKENGFGHRIEEKKKKRKN